MNAEELQTILRLIDAAEDPGYLVPLDVVREFARIRQAGLTGTLEIDIKDGEPQSRRWIPPRVRIERA